MDTWKPSDCIDIADKGKADPYHAELSETDAMELAELFRAVMESYAR